MAKPQLQLDEDGFRPLRKKFPPRSCKASEPQQGGERPRTSGQEVAPVAAKLPLPTDLLQAPSSSQQPNVPGEEIISASAQPPGAGDGVTGTTLATILVSSPPTFLLVMALIF